MITQHVELPMTMHRAPLIPCSPAHEIRQAGSSERMFFEILPITHRDDSRRCHHPARMA